MPPADSRTSSASDSSSPASPFPPLLLRLVPVWFAWVGLVVAILAELSFLTMVIEPLQFLIPIDRFGSLIWLVAAGFLLPKTRHSQGERA